MILFSNYALDLKVQKNARKLVQLYHIQDYRLHYTGYCGKIAKHSATILSDVLKHLYITQFYM